jgi:curved DNA-binding protein CbpA
MDYYRILGVLPTADDCVIRAAHGVLTKKYRTGRGQASTAEAEARMARIEEAFGILSDPAGRTEYDKQRTQGDSIPRQFGEQDPAEDLFEESGWQSDWDLACKFYPELKEIEAQFRAISPQLAFTFSAFLLETKRFPEAAHIAREMELAYLGGYFGEDPEILEFAKHLIVSGNIEAVRTLSNALRVLGSSTPARVIIETLSQEIGERDVTGEARYRQTEQDDAYPAADAGEEVEAAADTESPEPSDDGDTQSPREEIIPEETPRHPAESEPLPRAAKEPEKAGAALLKNAPRAAPRETRDAGPKAAAKDPKTRAAIQEFLRVYRASGGLDVDSAVVLVRALGGTVDSKKPGAFLGEGGIEVVFRGQRISFGPDDFLQWAERKLLPEALSQR